MSSLVSQSVLFQFQRYVGTLSHVAPRWGSKYNPGCSALLPSKSWRMAAPPILPNLLTVEIEALQGTVSPVPSRWPPHPLLRCRSLHHTASSTIAPAMLRALSGSPSPHTAPAPSACIIALLLFYPNHMPFALPSPAPHCASPHEPRSPPSVPP